MLVRTVVSPALGANCYLVASGPGQECLVLDPGYAVEEQVAAVARDEGLTPVAVLVTHGHLDHVAAVTTVAGGGLTTYVHEADAYRLADPYAQLGPVLLAMVGQQFGGPQTWQPPARVETFAAGAVLELAGLRVVAHHAPGHTEGSTLYEIPGVPDRLPSAVSEQVDRVVCTGDVLFAGTIGRTDLHGGDHARMETTLREVVLGLPDTALVLPGHGPASTIARERQVNPFLATGAPGARR